MTRQTASRIAASLIAVAAVTLAVNIRAAVIWDGDTDNDWADNTNWDIGGAGGDPAYYPGENAAGDNGATINGGTAVLSDNLPQTVYALFMWHGTVTLDSASSYITAQQPEVRASASSSTINVQAGEFYVTDWGQDFRFGRQDSNHDITMNVTGGHFNMQANGGLKMGGRSQTTTLYVSAGQVTLANLTVGADVGTDTHIAVEVDGSQATSFSAQSISVSDPQSGSRTFTFTADAGGVTSIDVTNNLTLGDGLGTDYADLSLDYTGLEYGLHSFDLFTYGGALTGEFDSISVLDGKGNPMVLGADPFNLAYGEYAIAYGDGSDDSIILSLNSIPEPSSFALLGIFMLVLNRRRRG
jgi:hypothetical protein